MSMYSIKPSNMAANGFNLELQMLDPVFIQRSVYVGCTQSSRTLDFVMGTSNPLPGITT